jgi:hypothetical protein
MRFADEPEERALSPVRSRVPMAPTPADRSASRKAEFDRALERLTDADEDHDADE